MRLHDKEQSRQQRPRQAQVQPAAPTAPAAKMYPDLTLQAETKEDYSTIQAAVENQEGMNSIPIIQWDENSENGRYGYAIVTALTEQFPARMDTCFLMSLKRGDEESALQHCLQHSGLAATAWTAAEISPFVELFKLVFKNGLGKDIVKMTFGQPNNNKDRGNRGREGGGRERLNQDEM